MPTVERAVVRTYSSSGTFPVCERCAVEGPEIGSREANCWATITFGPDRRYPRERWLCPACAARAVEKA